MQVPVKSRKIHLPKANIPYVSRHTYRNQSPEAPVYRELAVTYTVWKDKPDVTADVCWHEAITDLKYNFGL
jgi:hypothetical protein